MQILHFWGDMSGENADWFQFNRFSKYNKTFEKKNQSNRVLWYQNLDIYMYHFLVFEKPFPIEEFGFMVQITSFPEESGFFIWIIFVQNTQIRYLNPFFVDSRTLLARGKVWLRRSLDRFMLTKLWRGSIIILTEEKDFYSFSLALNNFFTGVCAFFSHQLDSITILAFE